MTPRTAEEHLGKSLLFQYTPLHSAAKCETRPNTIAARLPRGSSKLQDDFSCSRSRATRFQHKPGLLGSPSEEEGWWCNGKSSPPRLFFERELEARGKLCRRRREAARPRRRVQRISSCPAGKAPL